MFLNTGLQGIILKKDLILPWKTFLNFRLVKILFSGVLTGGIIFYFKQSMSFVDLHFTLRCIYLAAYLGFIALCYFSICIILGERSMVTKVMSRFSRKK